jgi:ribosomal protein S6E (S10)
VVVDAALIEPVSKPSNSLRTGKITGNFAESGLPMRFPSLIHERIQQLAAKFPTQRNREFLEA